MVQTFLVSSDFALSASLLDKKRLFKQVVEAHQLYNVLGELELIAEIYSVPMPPSQPSWTDSPRNSWRSFVASAYRNSEHHIAYVRGGVTLDCATFALHATSYNWLHLTCSGTHVSGIPTMCVPKDSEMPGWVTIKLGWINHPAANMWLGHRDKLVEYINAHITESTRRGINHKYQLLPFTHSPGPWWITSPDFHLTHRIKLVYKELSNSENPWYVNLPGFVPVGTPITDIEYLWPKP